MAGEIKLPYDRTARVTYAIVWDATGRPMRTDTFVAEAYVTANRASKYAIALTELGTASKEYNGTMPAFPAGVYSITAYDCAAGAPVTTNANEANDSLVGVERELYWTGTVVAPTSRLDFTQSVNVAVSADTLGTVLAGLYYRTYGVDVHTTTQAAIAAAWGARVIGNARTADYFLQGGFNKTVRGTNAFTVYTTDDTTILATGPTTADGNLSPLASMDPT